MKVHIVGPRDTTRSWQVVFILDPIAEESVYSSLLWNLYSPAAGSKSTAIHPKIILDNAFKAFTILDFYVRTTNTKLVERSIMDQLFADYGICISTNNDDKCNVGSIGVQGDKINGRSAWKNVKAYRLDSNPFGYPESRE